MCLEASGESPFCTYALTPINQLPRPTNMPKCFTGDNFLLLFIGSDTRVQCTAAHPVGIAYPGKQFFFQSEGIRSTFTSASSILCCPFIDDGHLFKTSLPIHCYWT